MRAAALVLLCSCAPGPASIPWVHIDRSLTGAVMSRKAAEAIDAYRERERAKFAHELVDANERAKRSEVRERQAAWWMDNGPLVIGGTSILSIIIGIVIGSQFPAR